MNKTKNILFLAILISVVVSCLNDDDGVTQIPARDAEEVRLENEIEIQTFLESHYYEIENESGNPNFEKIVFKRIDSPDAPQDAIPLSEVDELTTKSITKDDVNYEIYILQLREGAASERRPFFADSVLVTYQGYNIENEVFDGSPTPLWIDLSGTIVGFRETFTEHRGASGFVENSDGTIAFNDDYGTGAVIIPSGLAYFNQPPISSNIGTYEPIIFSYKLFRSRIIDHDEDGIPSYLEDINATRELIDVDTDDNGVPNYVDADDDGDETPTIEEIIINDDGSITFPDTNNNGTPDYLDPTYPTN